ncbi:MAG: peptidyl-prolyl cis-trans isomerase [Thermoclostridium sp.]|nr:peptidyl-prolyl cis-trans isomerase [Thermoclostridium sp.]
MKKRRFAIVTIVSFLAILMSLGAILNAWPQSAAQDRKSAAKDSIGILLNGSPLQISAAFKDGRVLVPIEQICHYLQCGYEKDDSQKLINFTKNANVPDFISQEGGNAEEIEFVNSGYQTMSDGLVLFIDTFIHNNVFYIDLEYLAQSFNFEAQWNDSDNAMLLTEYPTEYMAEVNGEMVPLRFFNERYLAGLVRTQAQNTEETLNEETINQIKEDAFNETVELILVAQLAYENGMVIDDDIKQMINFYLESTVEKFGGITSFREYIQSRGATYQDAVNYFTYGVIREEAVNKLTEGITPSEELMRYYYDTNQQSFIKPAKAIVQHIIIPSTDENENSYDDKKIEEQRFAALQIKQRIDAGEDFDALREEYSMDYFADTASNPEGFEVVKDQLAIAGVFEDAVFALEPGQISDVVTTYRGFHIIKLISKVAQKAETFDEARAQISNDLQYSARIDFYRGMLESKKENSEIRRLID